MLDGVGGQHHAPATLPPGNTRYALCRRMDGSQGQSGNVRNSSPPPGFNSRTVRPVASRCTDWVFPADKFQFKTFFNILFLPSWKTLDCTLLYSRSVTYHRNKGVAICCLRVCQTGCLGLQFELNHVYIYIYIYIYINDFALDVYCL